MHRLRPRSMTRGVPLLLFAAGSAAAQTSGAPAPPPDADLIGLWGGDTLFSLPHQETVSRSICRSSSLKRWTPEPRLPSGAA